MAAAGTGARAAEAAAGAAEAEAAAVRGAERAGAKDVGKAREGPGRAGAKEDERPPGAGEAGMATRGAAPRPTPVVGTARANWAQAGQGARMSDNDKNIAAEVFTLLMPKV